MKSPTLPQAIPIEAKSIPLKPQVGFSQKPHNIGEGTKEHKKDTMNAGKSLKGIFIIHMKRTFPRKWNTFAWKKPNAKWDKSPLSWVKPMGLKNRHRPLRTVARAFSPFRVSNCIHTA